MNNKKLIIFLIILCFIFIIIAMVLINNIKQDSPNIVDKEERQYIEDTVTVKEKYEYNEFSYSNIYTEQLLQMYLLDYKSNCLDNPENAYKLLNKEYREKKFENLDSYLQYINKNKEEIAGAKVNKFTVNNFDNFKEYIIQDQFGNYYIFYVTAVMEYTVMLDNYTVASESFKQEYNKVDSEEKALMNLNRFLEAIENQDYEYAYNKLYSTFKGSNFPTQLDFENYINQDWINYDNIEKVNIEKQSEIYVCTVNTGQNEKKFLLKLENDAEYLISFTI